MSVRLRLHTLHHAILKPNALHQFGRAKVIGPHFNPPVVTAGRSYLADSWLERTRAVANLGRLATRSDHLGLGDTFVSA